MPDGSQPAKPDPDHLGAGVCSAFLSGPCVVGSVRAVPVWPERFFDGKIARRFHQVSALGKVLDPVADKITQITIAVMLFLEFHKSTSGAMRAFSWVFLFFLCKEGLMILGGAVMLAVGLRPGAAEIYGKVATFAFYGVMLAIIAFGPGFGAFVQLGASPMPDWMIMILVVVSAILTLVALISYLPETFRQFRDRKKPQQEPPQK